MRLLLACLLLWVFVSGCLYVWGHLNNQDQASVGKALFFGFITALLTGAVIGGLVLLF